MKLQAGFFFKQLSTRQNPHEEKCSLQTEMSVECEDNQTKNKSRIKFDHLKAPTVV